MSVSPIPIRTPFLVKISTGESLPSGQPPSSGVSAGMGDYFVSWPWIKWLMEQRGTPPPFDPESLIALTIAEPEGIDVSEEAATRAALSTQLDTPVLRDADIEQIAVGVSLMVSDSGGQSQAGVSQVEAIGLTIDGGGSVPSTGSKGFILVPYSCVITSWTLLADAAGDCQITISAGTYAAFPIVASIVAAAPPAMTGVQKNTNSVLSGWTKAISANTVLEFNLDSVVTCTRITLELQTVRS